MGRKMNDKKVHDNNDNKIKKFVLLKVRYLWSKDTSMGCVCVVPVCEDSSNSRKLRFGCDKNTTN